MLEPLAVADDVRRCGRRVSRTIWRRCSPRCGERPRRCSEDVAPIGFAGAPWTIALYMVEGGGGTDGRARDWAYRDPDGSAALIDVLVEATVVYLDRQPAAGAEAVQLFDSWAGLWPPTSSGGG